MQLLTKITIVSTINRFLWLLLTPIRWYIRYSIIHRAKKFLIKNFILPILPKGYFYIHTTTGKIIEFDYHETLGITTLINHCLFESVEINCLSNYIIQQSTFMDIGANIGLYSILLSDLAKNIIAIEPLPDNVERIKRNIHLNQIDNVKIYSLALSDTIINQQLFYSTKDSAFASIKFIANARQIKIQISTLDAIWHELNYPIISVLKLDVEGAEIQVLKGGIKCITHCKPVMLIEANTQQDYQQLLQLLTPLGYDHSQPKGFNPWNYLFIPR
jgi:FkbM family methyltransferase